MNVLSPDRKQSKVYAAAASYETHKYTPLYTPFSHRTAGGRPAASIGGLRGTAGATKEPTS